MTRFEDTGQVMVTGTVENVADRFLEAKSKLEFTTAEGELFRLSPSGEVQELDHLHGRKVAILGIIDEFDNPPILNVLGYRVLAVVPPEFDSSQWKKKPGRA